MKKKLESKFILKKNNNLLEFLFLFIMYYNYYYYIIILEVQNIFIGKFPLHQNEYIVGKIFKFLNK